MAEQVSRKIYQEAVMKYFMSFFLISITTSATIACDIPYSEFEAGIPHIDIVNCPTDTGIPDDLGFCRLVLSGPDAFVYGFKFTEDEACLSWVEETSLSNYLLK